jgi:hypothetical protein
VITLPRCILIPTPLLRGCASSLWTIENNIGKPTVRLSGNLGDLKNISGEVQPEEVLATSVLQFPPAADPQSPTGGFGLAGWLAVVGMVTGLAGLLVAVITLRKSRQ